MTDSDVRTSSVYLVLERARWKYDPPRVVSTRTGKPSLVSGQIAVKVNLRIPMALFDKFIPVVEAELVEPAVIEPTVDLGVEEVSA